MTTPCFRTLVLASAVLLGAAAVAAPPLDKGLLDAAWFGPENLELRTTSDFDYLWVKPGVTIQGRTLHIAPWEDPVFLSSEKKRDAKDGAKASELTEIMPGRLRGALVTSLSGFARVSREEGDIKVVGRFVDCNAGSKAAKWIVGMGAGSATATWDMKLLDSATGELLVAMHHRVISGTAMSEIDDKIIKWLEKLGEEARRDFAAYGSGKPATK
jgi:hypothetical protein